MHLTRHADARAFLAVAEAALVEREAWYQLPFGIARTCAADPTRYPGRNYFATVEDEGRVTGCATMTPPHRLLLHVAPGEAQDRLADDLAAGGFTVSGVHGPVEFVGPFADLWCGRHGFTPRVHQDLRSFSLTEVVAAPPTPGSMRLATAADIPWVEHAYRSFSEEANQPRGQHPPEEIGRRSVREGRLFLWDDGGPVAQAAVAGATPNSARVGAVWTPPERRRRGYATALVEHVSRRVLAEGKRFCHLFTDLANPISNSIYPKVGYRPVADFRDIEFAPRT